MTVHIVFLPFAFICSASRRAFHQQLRTSQFTPVRIQSQGRRNEGWMAGHAACTRQEAHNSKAGSSPNYDERQRRSAASGCRTRMRRIPVPPLHHRGRRGRLCAQPAACPRWGRQRWALLCSCPSLPCALPHAAAHRRSLSTLLLVCTRGGLGGWGGGWGGHGFLEVASNSTAQPLPDGTGRLSASSALLRNRTAQLPTCQGELCWIRLQWVEGSPPLD